MTPVHPKGLALAAVAILVTLCAPGMAAAQNTGPTFEQVMAAPDDLALNLRFAESEAQAGNLLSSSAALERILLQAPGWSQARLLYAAVLYRLDDLAGAEQQLNQLDQSKLTDLQKAEARRYRSLIDGRRSRVTVNGEVSVGVAYQEDVIGSSFLQYNIPTTVASENGTSGVIDATFGAALKINPEGNRQLFGTVSFFANDELSNLPTDFQRGEIGFGLAQQNRMSAWRLGLLARNYRISTDHYLSEAGGEFQATRRPNTATTFSFTGEYAHQNYTEPSIDTLAPLGGRGHDGDFYDVTVGVTHRMDSKVTVSGAVGYSIKNAEYGGFSFDAKRIEAGYARQYDKGVYFNARGVYQDTDYEHPDFLLGAVRHDQTYRLRAALGAPISAFSPPGATGDAREGLILESAVTYDHRDSKLPLADYDSLGGEVRLVLRFGERR